MVGVGIEGKESSLARVSLVNYHGAVIMDEFVRQRERVVDYRTEFSGIRPSDMVNGKQGSFRPQSRPNRIFYSKTVRRSARESRRINQR